jgi:hypothetical protein
MKSQDPELIFLWTWCSIVMAVVSFPPHEIGLVVKEVASASASMMLMSGFMEVC